MVPTQRSIDPEEDSMVLRPLGRKEAESEESQPLPLIPFVVNEEMVRSIPSGARTMDAEEAMDTEPESGPWNLFGRLSIDRRTEAGVKAGAALVVLLLALLGSAITRHQTLQGENAVSTSAQAISAQAGTMFTGLAWSLLIAPLSILTIVLIANFCRILLQEKFDDSVAVNESEDPLTVS